MLFASLPLKNHQNFKGCMTNEYSINGTTLKEGIKAIPSTKELLKYHNIYFFLISQSIISWHIIVALS